jgi:hypothetical protein
MSDAREAFEKWAQGKSLLINIREEMMYAAGYINVKEMAWEAWQAALQHSGEPVAWMSPNKQSLEFSRPDTVYGSHTIPLYASPQPVAPDETMVAALCEIAKWIENSIGHKNHPVSFIARKALLSAGKGGE